MRRKIEIIFIMVLFGLLVFLLSLMRSYIDKISLIAGFDVVLTRILSGLWELISNPIIFISLLVIGIILHFRKYIFQLIPYVREVNTSILSLKLSPKYSPDDSKPILDDDISKDPQIRLMETTKERVFSNLQINYIDSLIMKFGGKTCKFILSLDRRVLRINEFIDELREAEILSIRSEGFDETQEHLYYLGVFDVFDYFVVKPLVERKLSDDNKTAFFELKPGVREKLTERIKELERELEREEAK